MAVTTVLVLLALLTVKHMFADYFLQTPAMLRARDEYLHAGRAQHCAVHVAGSALVLFGFGVNAGLVVLVLVAEFVLHYHIDFGKGVWSERAGHTPAQAGYWRAFGVDQTLHQLTYIGMVMLVA